jgi:hypothetical protein
VACRVEDQLSVDHGPRFCDPDRGPFADELKQPIRPVGRRHPAASDNAAVPLRPPSGMLVPG